MNNAWSTPVGASPFDLEALEALEAHEAFPPPVSASHDRIRDELLMVVGDWTHKPGRHVEETVIDTAPLA
jgi:hypothetical protein